ncbi:MAG: methyl-accepting chemotaxis protein [Desulfobacterales bacterium]|nr:methyl-accepting chemotaxis protein [Desulfobacterales bacterium]
MKLTIGSKVNILIVIALLMVGGASLFFCIITLQNVESETMSDYRSGVRNEKQNKIRDLVNSAYTIGMERLELSRDKARLRADYGNQVKAVVDQASSVFQGALAGGADPEDARAKSLEIINAMRWGETGKGYFWIHDLGGNMVLHPIKPKLNGKYVLDMKDPDGKRLFKEMNEVVAKSGAGFVDYKWPRPGFEKPVDKISYVKLFEPWGWVIGGGSYLESMEYDLQQGVLTTIGSIRYGADNAGFFFIFDSKGNCVLMPEDDQMVGKNFYNAKDAKGNLYVQAFIQAGDASPQGGFTEYFFPRAGGTEALPKLSFVRKLADWDWYIGTGVYTDEIEAAVATQREMVNDNMSMAILENVAVVSCVILVALLASYFFIAKGVVGPIRKIIDMLRDIAQGEGDLTRRIQHQSGDETQELAHWFNLFIQRMQEMISGVQSETGHLNDSSSSLAEISEQMNAGVMDTSERANSVAAASEEMSANMNSMAAAMEQASTNINTVSSSAQQMRSTIDEIAHNTETARSTPGRPWARPSMPRARWMNWV